MYLGGFFTEWHEVPTDNHNQQDDNVFTIYINAKYIGQCLRMETDEMEIRNFDYLFHICFGEVYVELI